jgi:hypothetical protein
MGYLLDAVKMLQLSPLELDLILYKLCMYFWKEDDANFEK